MHDLAPAMVGAIQEPFHRSISVAVPATSAGKRVKQLRAPGRGRSRSVPVGALYSAAGQGVVAVASAAGAAASGFLRSLRRGGKRQEPPARQVDVEDESEDDMDLAEVIGQEHMPVASSLEGLQGTSPTSAPSRPKKLFQFLEPPPYWRFAMNAPGDAGFDPLHISQTPKMFWQLREAELKHARLAMLAAVGWPLSELWHPHLANAFGLENLLCDGGFAPSLLNGGFGDSHPLLCIFLVLSLEAAAVIDCLKEDNRDPGDYGFDPLQLRTWSPPAPLRGALRGRAWMHEAELKNGRLAMLAVTAFAFQEFVTKVPVVRETPFLFNPCL